MKQAIIIAAVNATAVLARPGSGKPGGSGNGGLDAQLRNDKAFLSFASKWNKDISETDEYIKRQKLYHAQDEVINAINARADPDDPDALRYRHDWFSDMTEEEKSSWMGYQEDEARTGDRSLPWHSSDGRTLPTFPNAVNWASDQNPHGKKKMHDVKQQGCGDCWAFAVTTTMEGTLAIKTGKEPFRLSEQQAVDCTLGWKKGGKYNKHHFRHTGDLNKDYGCVGCKGCSMRQHYRFVKDHGIMSDKAYPYEGKELGRCKHDFNNIVGRIEDFWELFDIDLMKERLAQQPLDAAICASNLGGYGSGIVKQTDGCCKKLNHAITIVGYKLCGEGDDDEDSDFNPAPEKCTVDKWWMSCQKEVPEKRKKDKCIPYWIIQNSWSRHWGDNGFIKIEITDGKGVCGINGDVEYSEWKGKY